MDLKVLTISSNVQTPEYASINPDNSNNNAVQCPPNNISTSWHNYDIIQPNQQLPNAHDSLIHESKPTQPAWPAHYTVGNQQTSLAQPAWPEHYAVGKQPSRYNNTIPMVNLQQYAMPRSGLEEDA